MKQNNLSETGLSMSQAQSISNLCNQYGNEIDDYFINVNNFSKSVDIIKSGELREQTVLAGKPLPPNSLEILIKKCGYRACQAFLFENIKAKEQLLTAAQNLTGDVDSVNFLIKFLKPDTDTLQELNKLADLILTNHVPENPKYSVADFIESETEDFGWSSLTSSEIAEYLEAEAYAAHLGKFIHNKGILQTLRNTISTIPSVEWMNIKDNEKTPVFITVHHTSEDLLKLHTDIESEYRKYEQRVNYFKSKVKNLTTAANANIAEINASYQAVVAKQNAEKSAVYQQQLRIYRDTVELISTSIEKYKHDLIKKIAGLRILVPARFQSIIDELKKW